MIPSRTGLVALAAVGVGIALGAVVQLALRGPVLRSVEVTTSTVTFTAHHPPVLRAAHRDCTRPLEVIGQVGGDYVWPNALDQLFGVAASRTGCTIAVWNPDGAYVSRDDGATWTHMLAAMLLAHDVAVDDAENVYLLANDDDLAVAHPDGTSAVHPLPFANINRVATSNGWVIVAAARELAVSHDEGATWQRHPTPASLPRFTSSAVFVDAAGTVRLAIGGETPDDPITLWDSAGAGWQRLWASPQHVPYRDPQYPDWREGRTASIDSYAFAHDGTLVAEVYDRSGDRFFVVDAHGTATKLAALPSALDLLGVVITGTHGDRAVRDAHGKLLVVTHRRGPVRLDDRPEHLDFGGAPFSGRWLTGDLQAE
ncbi:MAG: hypothetical protein ABI467_10225 [Kofleriaceae bacterium]